MPNIQIQFRRATAANWTSANTILASGEMGLETDTNRYKIGDGTTAWNSLAYANIGYTGSAGATGYTGSVGSTGTIGYTGSQGSIGYTGSSGRASWQSGKTSNFNAVAGEGYFVDTSSSTITATLPASATLGDEITFTDAVGTFDTNNLTIARNGHKIQGVSEDLTISVERSGFTLVYYNVAQGWILKYK